MNIKNKISFKEAYHVEYTTFKILIFFIIYSTMLHVLNVKYHFWTTIIEFKLIVISSLIILFIIKPILYIVDLVVEKSVDLIKYIRSFSKIYRAKENIRKLPLTFKELEELDIKTLDEYFKFLRKHVKIPTIKDEVLWDANDKIFFTQKQTNEFTASIRYLLYQVYQCKFLIIENSNKDENILRESIKFISTLHDYFNSKDRMTLTVRFTSDFKTKYDRLSMTKVINLFEGVRITTNARCSALDVAIDVENCE